MVGAPLGPPDTVHQVIKAFHGLVYADDPEQARAFFRDVLEWPFVDAHDGWLIFATGPSELGVHPTSGTDATGRGWSVSQHHEISFICDDLDETVAQLEEKGATFLGDPEEQGFGRTVSLEVPGGGSILLYEPHHMTAYDR